MSTPNGHFPTSNSFCQNCGRRNPPGTTCTECQSLPQQNSTVEQSTDPDVGLIDRLENLFHNNRSPQIYTRMLLPMLMPPRPSDLPQHRHRRGRPSRRIKRAVYRYLPSSFHTPDLFDTQLIIFDPNETSTQSRLLTQLLTEDIDPLANTNYDVNLIPTLTMNSSNLLLHPLCAICLENFDSSSQVKQLPLCHHIFHTNCLTEWLRHHQYCPMCRTNISSTEQRSNSISNDHWMEQFLFQTFQSNLPYPSIKSIDLTPIPTNPPESTPVSSDTPQLPRFDSSSNPN